MPKYRQCGVQQVNERLTEQNPALRDKQLKIEHECQRSIEKGEAQRVWRKLITLPVVVHVVYKTDEENISDEQVSEPDRRPQPGLPRHQPRPREASPRPGRAWRPTRTSSSSCAEITRTETERDSFGTGDTVKRNADGGIDPRPTTKFLNVWVCNLGEGLLGYAQFPGGPAKTDGVVILYTAFGTTGAASAPFNLGRTATHEVGHWLNLRHIWGDRTDCSGTDQVSDTPKAQMPNYGTPTWPHITCNNGPNGDMFMNYMDYVDDAAMFMFTQGQAARINATLAGPRKKIAGL